MNESNSSHFGIPKLKREGTWRAIIAEKPAADNDAIEAWEIKDEMAQGTICLLLEDDQIAQHILEIKIPPRKFG